MKFRGQTSKNVHDIRKVCLQTTLCVLACFVKFYMFFWTKLMWQVLNSYIYIFGLEMSGRNSPWTIQVSLRKDPSCEPRLPRPGPNRLRKMMAHGPVDTSSMGVMVQDLPQGDQSQKLKSLNQTTRCQDGPFLEKWSVVWNPSLRLVPAHVYCNARGEVLISAHVQIREREFNQGYFGYFKHVYKT